ncbi:NACHT domain- and WD repeat-containing protein 1 [Trichonephila clavata]|uniref:NACHT domain- and WD repeat-containing protein 1 n=1 Tax=Trichonephila clavata TaxID=2740835 RepID=A0A8X6HDC7_TRICU|nr:NACHT domain- and WD repeat-containing protein 1 [Trichonephila clavata]
MAHDLLYQDDALQATFFGNLTAVPEPPSRLVNIFVSSTKTDLEHERRQLHEVLVPQLQRDWSSLGIDIQLVDVQNGADEDAIIEPQAIAQQLEEIEDCHKTSLGCFFLCLIGNKYRPFALPASIDASEYNHIHNAANEAGLDASLLDNHFLLDTNLLPPRYVLQAHNKSDNSAENNKEPMNKIHQESEESNWPEEEDKLVRIIQYGARIAIQEGLIEAEDLSQSYLFSGVHTHLRHALKLSKNDSNRIICIVRQFESIDTTDNAAHLYIDSTTDTNNLLDNLSSEDDSSSGLNHLLEDVILNVDKKNVAYFRVPWCKSGLDPEFEEHSKYLKSFSEIVSSMLKNIIQEATTNWSPNWELFPTAYRKSVQEVYRESQSHLLNSRRYLRELGVSQSLDSDCAALLQIQRLMLGEDEKLRHSPIIVCGKDGCGKSTLLSQVITYCTEWLGGDVIRIVRHVGQSPCSTYTSELLRNLCLHISLVFDFDPIYHSFELGELSIWFQDLLKMVESTSTDLVIVLDDLHELRSPTGSQSAILGWLPWNLPPNVHVVCSISEDAEEVIRLLRSRSSCNENFVHIPPLGPSAALSMLQSNLRDRKRTLNTAQLEAIKERLSSISSSSLYIKLLSRIAERWHSWVEVAVSSIPEPLLKQYYVDRRPYLHWSHNTIAKYIMNTYVKTPRDLQACYTELAHAFHLGFLMEKEKEENSGKDPALRKDDWCDILREIDELWFHLLRSGDRKKLKDRVVCNFDFLQCAVSGASVSYVRSLLELVKCHILDWEVELLSAVTKQAVDVLSQDPSQLATELLNWLKPFIDISDSTSVRNLVNSALKFCNKSIHPRLVPTNSWLTLSLPPQVASMTVPHTITHSVTTPDSQHVMCASNQKEINMFHLPSKNHVRTFQGHKAPITCLHVTSSGHWLISGSEDTDVIVWNIDSGQIKHRMSNHITGVMCVTTTHSESRVLSGSEIGVVIVATLDTGQVIQRLDNHRGLISCISVHWDDDVFVTGSNDKTVCVWSLENFTLYNTITLPSAVRKMDISRDNSFLVIACDDQSLHVRSLTTGSEAHVIQGLSSELTAVCFGHDNCRCVVGCADGKCYVFDVHFASSLIATISGHSEAICSVQVQANDTFLVTAGGNKVAVWSFTLPKKENIHKKQKVKRLDSHREPIMCMSVSKDGTLAVSGSKDNLLKVWNLTSGEVTQTLDGHTASITCVAFAPNGSFVVSGSEDTTLRVFGLMQGVIEATFKEHQTKIVGVCVASDSRRILSADNQGYHRLWTADNGNQIYSISKSTVLVTLHSNVVFTVSGKNDTALKFWPLMDVDSEKSVSHSDSILCYTVTHDCETVITGSNDMSLKVWEVATGKLTQVLAGHEGSVTCVALAPLSPSLVVSGSSDCTLILWDMLTGTDNLTLRGHKDTIKCVSLTPDGSTLLSGSADNTIQLWNIHTGERISMLDLHAQLISVSCSFNLNHVVVQLAKSSSVPILRLHNNPAKGITLDMLPGHQEDLKSLGPSGALPKRVLQRGNLKREQSFDSLFWELKSSSPRHDFLPNLDDLKRQPVSLSTAGSVWDGTKGRLTGGILRPSDPLNMQPKPKLAKHKLLKKQQSMFAFFPDHNQSTQNLARDLETRKADLLAKIQSANRQLLDSPAENPSETDADQEQKRPAVADSTVCAIA